MPQRVTAAFVAGLSAFAAGCNIDSRFIYYPQTLTAEAAAQVVKQQPLAEPFAFATADGARLEGWLVGARAARDSREPKPLVLYYGGNAEEVSWITRHAAKLDPYAVLLVNYRGYGRSTGKPHQRELFADALAIFDEVTKRAEVDPRRVVVWGRSLGSGIAVHVAAERPVAGVVLITPYDSMSALAARHMPMLKSLLTQTYDSISVAPRIRQPMLALATPADTLVPVEHTERLVKAWAGPTEFKRFTGVDHGTIHAAPDYWPSIATFLKKLP